MCRHDKTLIVGNKLVNASITNILQRPLFYDSPEIKRVLKDIDKSREAILYVANVMTSINLKEINDSVGDSDDES